MAKELEICEIFTAPYFSWRQPGVGFGQISFTFISDEKSTILYCDDEGMGQEYVRQALHALADYLADTVIFDSDS